MGGWEESCTILLQKGANINAKDNSTYFNGETVLMHTFSGNCSIQQRVDSEMRILKMFLKAGADTTITNDRGKTAYEYFTNGIIGEVPEWRDYRKRSGQVFKKHELRIHLQRYKLPTFLLNFFVFLFFALYNCFKRQNHYKIGNRYYT